MTVQGRDYTPPHSVMRFALARMCPVTLLLTLIMAALPAAFLIAGTFGPQALWGPALFLILIYGWVWTRFRPTAFVVHTDALEVIWPLKRGRISRDGIAAVRLVDRHELPAAGGPGRTGGFGWLWTSRRGIVQMYVSRLDRFVWIERGRERPWLITPERPEAFVSALRR